MKIFLKHSVACCFMSFISASAFSAEMPTQLIGSYSTDCSSTSSSYKETGMWDGIRIEKNGVKLMEGECKVAKAVKVLPNEYLVTLNCSIEGENSTLNETYKPSGSILTVVSNGESVKYSRCSSKIMK